MVHSGRVLKIVFYFKTSAQIKNGVQFKKTNWWNFYLHWQLLNVAGKAKTIKINKKLLKFKRV